MTTTFADATLVEETNAYIHSKEYSDSVFAPTTEIDAAREFQLKNTKTVVLTGTDPVSKKNEILTYFHSTYDLYEKLFEPLSEKAFYMRADPLRHPLIFYYGHTACFFINKLRLAKMVKARVNKRFESMFAVGVDEMSWDDLLPTNYEWPSVTAVKEYRDQVRAVVEEAILKTPLVLPITWDSPFFAVMMGIEHERIHLETSTVLIRQLPLSVIKTHPFWEPCHQARSDVESVPANKLLPVVTAPTPVRLGKPLDHPLYGWDNEYGVSESVVQPFSASQYLVTNAEYLQFVNDGGYRKKEFWTDEGWKWAQFRCKTAVGHPRFWVRHDVVDTDDNTKTEWKLRLMLEEVDMPWDWPAEVNYLEAKAFCNWMSAKTGKSIRMPMEDEYQLLREQITVDYPYVEKAPGNFNLEYCASSTPVDMFPPTTGGFYDVVGNVWQHCETPIDAFQDFKVHPLYDDFSVPTFDQKHNLLRGSSWISTGNEATPEARYAFRRHFYQHAGIRYIETDRKVELSCDQYERDESVAKYAAFHYGPEHFNVPNFPKAIADLAIKLMKDRPTRRALDLGCTVGRSTFELGRVFEYALGLDLTARFIRVADQLKQERHIKYSVLDEGKLLTNCTHALSELKLESARDKVEFFQADPCNLDPKWGKFDLVLAANVLDRVHDPRQFLATIHDRLTIGGLLIIASPYDWNEEFTPKEMWLGGYVDHKTGQEVHTFDVMQDILAERFRLVDQPHGVQFVMRLARRKFQHSVAEVSVWERTA